MPHMDPDNVLFDALRREIEQVKAREQEMEAAKTGHRIISDADAVMRDRIQFIEREVRELRQRIEDLEAERQGGK